MKIIVNSNYSGEQKIYEGNPNQIEAALRHAYSWLRGRDLEQLLENLDSQQAYDVDVDLGGGQMWKSEGRSNESQASLVGAQLGVSWSLQAALQAARFLAPGQPQPTKTEVRAALWEADGNSDLAALRAYRLEPSQDNLRALRMVQETHSMAKGLTGEQHTVVALDPSADEDADGLRRAYDQGSVEEVNLGGQHTQHAQIARDQYSGHSWILKPESGKDSPQAGAQQNEVGTDQPHRESAFYAAGSEVFHLGDWLSPASLVSVDGRDVAMLRMLPWDWRTLEDLRENPGLPQRLLHRYLAAGALHRWAVLDYVLGNPDRHAGNLMVDGEHHDVVLIDHDTALAGPQFDPVHDRSSFVPYYLRAWAPSNWSQMAEADRLRYMPRVNSTIQEALNEWARGISGKQLVEVLQRYGVNPGACMERLARLRYEIEEGRATDDAINRLWVGEG